MAGFTAAPFIGHLSDKIGRRHIIVASLAVTAVVLVFMALAGRQGGLFLLNTTPMLSQKDNGGQPEITIVPQHTLNKLPSGGGVSANSQPRPLST